jgi:methylthioribulose-1-phosphate dehydratase
MTDRADNLSFHEVANQLMATGTRFYARGWVLGTSGNFSAVVEPEPLRLAITSSGIDKGEMTADQILEVDREGKVIKGEGRPSAETSLHLTVVRLREAGAVLHTHSVWSNILSDIQRHRGGLQISGFEMLKGLEGVNTHEHGEWLPIIDNSQDMPALASAVEEQLSGRPERHGFLIHRHGLYTWGRDLKEARRHVEIFEYLLEVLGRESLARMQPVAHIRELIDKGFRDTRERS